MDTDHGAVGPVRRVALIANPAAAKGRGLFIARRLEGELRAGGISVDRHVTSGPGDATRLAGQAVADGVDALVACGGDGTVHEVVQALAGTPVRLAVAPAGRGNDLARALGIPRDPPGLAKMVLTGCTRSLDLGAAGDLRFASVATLGFDAAVSQRAARGVRFLRGTAAYVAAVLLALARFRAPVVEIHGAGHAYRGPILLAATANTPLYGGGMQIAPGARPDDGLFRVCLIREVGRLRVLQLLPLVMSGSHPRHPAVEIWDTPYLEVTADPPSVLYADGELLGTTPIRLEILPRALQVLVPPPPPASP
jgi:diacylglycerol kinase (ATP)